METLFLNHLFGNDSFTSVSGCSKYVVVRDVRPFLEHILWGILSISAEMLAIAAFHRTERRRSSIPSIPK